MNVKKLSRFENELVNYVNKNDAQLLFGKAYDDLSVLEKADIVRFQFDKSHPDWKPIMINDIDTKCIVDQCGNTMKKDGSFLKIYELNTGYQGVYIPLYGTMLVHRLVAQAFIPNPENKPQVNHINGIKTCNWYRNLEWVTAKENAEHAWRIGLVNNHGENQGNAKYSNAQIADVCKLLEEGKSYKEINMITGVDISVISDVRTGYRWKKISQQYKIRRSTRKYSDEQVHATCRLLEDPKIPHQEISDKTGVSINTIKDIMRRTSYRRISDAYDISPRSSAGEYGRRSKYTSEQVENACKLFLEGHLKPSEISRHTGIPMPTVIDIVSGRRWRSVSSKYGIHEPARKKDMECSTTISKESTT